MDALKPNLFDLDLSQFTRLVQDMGEMPYRAKQILAWVYRRLAGSFQEMTDLPRELRQQLECSVDFGKLDLLSVQEGKAGWSKKYLWGKDGAPLFESVLLKYAYGMTACVSTQIGCPVGCAFCASREQGFDRSLTKGEILEEFVGMCRRQKSRVGRLVFMGTGEPFHNYREVMGAINILTLPEGYGLSRRRITVSTVGIPGTIRRFAEDSKGVRLAVSLHAASNQIRDRIIPYNKRYPVEEVMASLKDYSVKTGQRVTVEYLLLGGLNDSPREAGRLASLVKGMDVLVNLIPWNPVPGLPFSRPKPADVAGFREELERNRVKVTVRRSLGGSVDAACGQLGRSTKVR